jgi:hypothetical protein
MVATTLALRLKKLSPRSKDTRLPGKFEHYDAKTSKNSRKKNQYVLIEQTPGIKRSGDAGAGSQCLFKHSRIINYPKVTPDNDTIDDVNRNLCRKKRIANRFWQDCGMWSKEFIDLVKIIVPGRMGWPAALCIAGLLSAKHLTPRFYRE